MKNKLSLETILNEACDFLPCGWEVVLTIKNSRCSVLLYDLDGDCQGFVSDHESLQDEIQDAVEAALQKDKETTNEQAE